jgi:hypothetical protein
LALDAARTNLGVTLKLQNKESYSREEVAALFDNLLTGIVVGVKQAKDMLDSGKYNIEG